MNKDKVVVKPVKRWKWVIEREQGVWYVTEAYYSLEEVRKHYPGMARQPILATERVDHE